MTNGEPNQVVTEEDAQELHAVITRLRRRSSEAQERLTNGETYECPEDRSCGGFCLVRLEDGTRWKVPCPDADKKDCYYTREKRREWEDMLRSVGIPPRYWNIDPARIRPREAVEKYCGSIAKNVRQGRGLLLAGGVGVGKTCILSYVGQVAVLAGIWPTYLYVPDLSDALLDRNRREEMKSRVERTRLLLLDDWGVEYKSEFLVATYDALFEARYSENLPTLVTTNVTVKDLDSEKWMARIIDRWRETMSLVTIGGESQRG